MKKVEGLVLVIDDDPSVRRSLQMLMESVGLSVETFESAQDFLTRKLPDAPSCLVLDVRLPGLSGLDLQLELSRSGRQIPIIFITGHGDIPLTVRAMKAGAVEFLTKPFREQELLDAVMQGLERDRAARSRRAENADLRKHYEQLTPRECEVLGLIVAGMLNKQIAGELGASEATIKIHRARVMQKMGAQSVADLVRMAEKLEVALPKP
jgi:FixJ family two-component response regulator